jgi:hypothetical protein
MALTRIRRPAGQAHRRDRAATVVFFADPGDLARLHGSRLRLWDQAIARGRGFSLDLRLAEGSSPDGDRLIAARARMLVSPANRERLARGWDRLLRTARQPPSRGRATPLRRARVLAAEPDIYELQRSLRSPLPVPVRGVAMARQILVDASGPVYNRRSEVDLRIAIQEAIRQMDPSIELMPGQRC